MKTKNSGWGALSGKFLFSLLCTLLLSISYVAEVQAQCNSQGNSTNWEYIQSVTFADVANNSGNNNGYADFSSPVVLEAEPGEAITFSLQAGFSNSAFSEEWRIFVDFNNNGSFDDEGETVFEGISSMTYPLQGSFWIPASAAGGETKVRVSMKYGSYPAPCEPFSYGEVEDYAISIVNGSEPKVKAKLSLKSDSGHWIGQGKDVTHTENDGEFIVSPNYNNDALTGIKIRYEGTDGTYYYLSFDAPYKELLEEKAYTGATGFPFNEGADPGFSILTNGRGCNKESGEFTVLNVTYAPDGSFESFAASFTHYCDDADENGPMLQGTVHYNFENAPLEYCEASAKYTSWEWISAVKLGDFENKDNKIIGYEDFTEAISGYAIPVKPGEFVVTLTPGFKSYAYLEHWAIWIDANQDGDFSDEGEELFRTATKTNQAVNTSIVIPEGLQGKTRLRVRMWYNSSTVAEPCGTTHYGQVEDYTLDIQGDLDETTYLLISRDNQVQEYSLVDGELMALSDWAVPYPLGTRPVYEFVRDVAVFGNSYLVTNGKNYPFLSVFNPESESWIDHDVDGWGNYGNENYSDIGVFGQYAFLPDAAVGYIGRPNQTKGVIRLDLETGQTERILTTKHCPFVTIGLDGYLYAYCGSGKLYVYDPSTLQQLPDVSIAVGYIAGFTVNADGDIFALSNVLSTGRIVKIHHMNSSGEQIKELQLLNAPYVTDIDLSSQGKIMVSGIGGYLALTDEDLTAPQVFQLGSSRVYTAFIE